MTLHLGQIVDGKYRIVRGIVGGAMGEVYDGENLSRGRRREGTPRAQKSANMFSAMLCAMSRSVGRNTVTFK